MLFFGIQIRDNYPLDHFVEVSTYLYVETAEYFCCNFVLFFSFDQFDFRQPFDNEINRRLHPQGVYVRFHDVKFAGGIVQDRHLLIYIFRTNSPPNYLLLIQHLSFGIDICDFDNFLKRVHGLESHSKL